MISVDRTINPRGLVGLVLCALAASGCTSKAHPVLPSPGGGNPGGLAGTGSADGGGSADTRATDTPANTDARDVAAADAISDANSGICNLLTQQGCPLSLACYPVAGVGRCLDVGPNTANTPCNPSLGAVGQCVPGLACVATTAMDVVCEPLCDVSNPPKGCLPSCRPLPGFTTIGYCPP
jgi:hypothetical protein